MPTSSDVESAPARTGPRWLKAAPVALCLLLNGAIFVGIAVRHPGYLRDDRSAYSADAIHYLLLGRNFWRHGEYSRSEAPPYIPDMLRTPSYPLFAGLLDVAGGPGLVYFAQALLQAGSCLLVYRIAAREFGQRAAFWASLLFGADLMLAVSNFEAMSEPLFVFLTLLGVDLLLAAIGLGRVNPTPVRRWILIGAVWGAAILARPVALYLLLLLVATVLILGVRAGRWRVSVRNAAVLACAGLLLPALWVARNDAVFSVRRLTHVDLNNLVYFVGAGAYQRERGLDLNQAQAAISREYKLVDYVYAANDHVAGRPLAQTVAELSAAWPAVVSRYPSALIQASAIGMAKATISHNVKLLALVQGQTWNSPQIGELARLRPEALQRLASNSPELVAAFVWQLGHTALTLFAGAIGIVSMLRGQQPRGLGLLILAIWAYFTLTMALFGLEAYWRCRAPAAPFAAILAGWGLTRIAARRSSSSSSANGGSAS